MIVEEVRRLEEGETVYYQGRPAVVVRQEETPTPSGGSIVTVVIRRPRAGEKRVFRTELDQGFRLEEPDRTRFAP
jgi:translation elongation factor P/translation initiation factor 5A